MFVTIALAELTLVLAISVPVVMVVAVRVPVDNAVCTALPIVQFAAFTPVVAKSVPVVIPFVTRAVPVTSRLNPGLVVEIPTFPPVVNIFPIVFAFPIADKLVVTSAMPVVTLVALALTAFKLPDKLTLAPVIVVADNQLVPTVKNVPVFATSEPVVMAVPKTFVKVLFVTIAFGVLMLVVARSVPVVM